MNPLAAAASLTDTDTDRLASSLYRAKAGEYEMTIERLMADNGTKIVRLTLSPQIRRALDEEAKSEAGQIVRTFNGLVENFVERNGSKPSLPFELQSYLRERARKRAPLIGRNAVVTARLDAQIAFYRANGVEPLFDFVGPHPQCPVCTALKATSPHKAEMVVAVGHPHPNCVVEGTEVQALGGAVAAQRAFYEGPVVAVAAGGQSLTVTANHPVATGRGWIAAKALREGDYLLRCLPRDRAVALGIQSDSYNNDVPRAEQVFQALQRSGANASVAAAAHDFHGDGVGIQGEVEVVAFVGGLLGESGPELLQLPGERSLVRSDVQPTFLSGDSSLSQGGDAVALAAPSSVSRADAGETHDSPAAFVEPSPQRLVADPEFRSEVGDALSCDVTSVKVTKARYFDSWSGHVFDFSTRSMVYGADGLLVHNCSHSWKPRPIKRKLPKVLSVPHVIAGIVGLRSLVQRIGSQDKAAQHVRDLALAGLAGAAAVEAHRRQQGQGGQVQR